MRRDLFVGGRGFEAARRDLCSHLFFVLVILLATRNTRFSRVADSDSERLIFRDVGVLIHIHIHIYIHIHKS